MFLFSSSHAAEHAPKPRSLLCHLCPRLSVVRYQNGGSAFSSTRHWQGKDWVCEQLMLCSCLSIWCYSAKGKLILIRISLYLIHISKAKYPIIYLFTDSFIFEERVDIDLFVVHSKV